MKTVKSKIPVTRAAFLSFSLPDDEYDFRMAINAVKFSIALEDIYNMVRSRLKYQETSDLTESDYKLLEDIRALTAVRDIE